MIERVYGFIKKLDSPQEPLSPEDTKNLQGRMNEVINAFDVTKGEDDKSAKTITFGKHRVGRTISDSPKPHLPHRQPDFDFFYDISDPSVPHLRRGIWISHLDVKIYTSIKAEGGEQIIYSTPKTPDEILQIVDSFSIMPQYPGDLRTEN